MLEIQVTQSMLQKWSTTINALLMIRLTPTDKANTFLPCARLLCVAFLTTNREGIRRGRGKPPKEQRKNAKLHCLSPRRHSPATTRVGGRGPAARKRRRRQRRVVTSLNLSVCKFRGFQKLVMSCVLIKPNKDAFDFPFPDS
jgi:hypothetical protein